MDFELQPARAQRLAYQLCGKDRLFSGLCTRRIGQQGHTGLKQWRKNGIVMITQIHALHRQRHQLAAALADGVHHQLWRGEFSCTGKQM
ncbi:hypothetical protein D3C78_1589460 [compost metagenome]